MNLRNLLGAFSAWREESQNLVLATVYETSGSTYSKIGARMLITADGRFQGMLSGGCLEGDLAERAAQVSASGTPQLVTYDLGSNDEELWGLGVGCDGLMRIFLQALTAEDDYQPFVAMTGVIAGDEPGVAATVLSSAHEQFRPGATLVCVGEEVRSSTIEAGWRALISAEMQRVGEARKSATVELLPDGKAVTLLLALLQPPPRVLVLGAGLDAQPVVRLMAELGWRVAVQDHRPAYIEKGDFRLADKVMNVPLPELGDNLDLSRFDAAVVMSHHLQTDREYLALLAPSVIPYVGLLGPVDRRRRLLADLGAAGARLTGRVHGPAGLYIGGRGPASIALSIVAEIHQLLMHR
jgi:xanthine/CO dehydrogenase XdhC/CoxF family maturation factor